MHRVSRQGGPCRPHRLLAVPLGEEGELASSPVATGAPMGRAMNVAGKHQGWGQSHPQVTTSNLIKNGPLQLCHQHLHSILSCSWPTSSRRHHGVLAWVTACLGAVRSVVGWRQCKRRHPGSIRSPTIRGDHERNRTQALQVERSSTPDPFRPKAPPSSEIFDSITRAFLHDLNREMYIDIVTEKLVKSGQCKTTTHPLPNQPVHLLHPHVVLKRGTTQGNLRGGVVLALTAVVLPFWGTYPVSRL